jgi:hypothetical protein
MNLQGMSGQFWMPSLRTFKNKNRQSMYNAFNKEERCSPTVYINNL